MKLVGAVVKILTLFALLVWPLPLAISSIPSESIFENSGDGEITFFNTHTNELLEINYKDRKGNYLEKGLEDIGYILRCRLTGEIAPINLKLIELADKIQDHFNSGKVEIISGYRSPELNSALRAKGRRVARNSYHIKGEAIDIRIPGVSIRELKNYALSLKAGGVGYYPGPGFVHVDVGPVRHW